MLQVGEKIGDIQTCLYAFSRHTVCLPMSDIKRYSHTAFSADEIAWVAIGCAPPVSHGEIGPPGHPGLTGIRPSFHAPSINRAICLPACYNGSMNTKHPACKRYNLERDEMVDLQIRDRGISNPGVLQVMKQIPRHYFVPDELVASAYDDYPLPIGHGQTISQPYIVALMTDLLQLSGKEKVLEIGTGSGYQTAILAELAHFVFPSNMWAAWSNRHEQGSKTWGSPTCVS